MSDKRCAFPGCTGVWDEYLARQDLHTGWRFDPNEPDVPAHDCRVQTGAETIASHADH